MATIVTRVAKGSPLTHVEVDTNFTNLNTAKLENLAAAAGAGSAAAPSISFAADTNTGAFNPAADTLAISTNGVERARINSSGNVGIGTISPARLLSISDVDNAAIRLTNTRLAAGQDQLFGAIEYEKLDTSGAGAGVVGGVRMSSGTSTASTAYMTFSTSSASANDVEAARIDSSGRLLVGTSTAAATGGVLQLSSGITFPATQVAATDANTLDDYEEGTWTPTIVDSIGAAVMTSGATGFYTKIGNLVTLSFNQISWSSKGTLATAPINISGFPFTSRNTNRQVGQINSASAGAFTNANRLILSMEANETKAGLHNMNATTNEGTPYSVTSLGTSGILYGMSLSFNV